MKQETAQGVHDYVEETKFGFWFLSTMVWERHVLTVAIADLKRLAGAQLQDGMSILDVGCGQGTSLMLLNQALKPACLTGCEVDRQSLHMAKRLIETHNLPATLLSDDCARINLPSNSQDVVFCHQTFHHLVRQEESLMEFFRVLKPGGLLLFAESTRTFIHSWTIRYLFHHPMHLQRSAEEYLAMIKAAGFELQESQVHYPFLWWSQKDLGLLKLLKLRTPIWVNQKTLVNLVARKPD